MSATNQVGRLYWAVLVVLVLVAAVLSWRSYGLGSRLAWNDWVNRVRIVGQPGSDAKLVQQWLGEPSAIKIPKEIGPGFQPRPPAVPGASKVYVYQKLFMFRGFWVAYVYVDGSGQVIATYFATS